MYGYVISRIPVGSPVTQYIEINLHISFFVCVCVFFFLALLLFYPIFAWQIYNLLPLEFTCTRISKIAMIISPNRGFPKWRVPHCQNCLTAKWLCVYIFLGLLCMKSSITHPHTTHKHLNIWVFAKLKLSWLICLICMPY